MPNKPLPAQDHTHAAPGVICIGLGPGDPDLLSVKAARLLRQARHVAYFRKPGRPGKALQIVRDMLHPDALHYAMEYPVTTEIPVHETSYTQLLAHFYDDWCARLAALAQTVQVAVLCEGDPFFYGSFMHLYVRLKARRDVPLTVIPGIPGMVGCWHATGIPMTWGDDTLTVLAGTLPEDQMLRHMQQADALVVMKVGRNLPRIRRALERSGRLHSAWLVQNGTTSAQKISRLTDAGGQDCPYFAIVLVPGQGRRPVTEDKLGQA